MYRGVVNQTHLPKAAIEEQKIEEDTVKENNNIPGRSPKLKNQHSLEGSPGGLSKRQAGKTPVSMTSTFSPS